METFGKLLANGSLMVETKGQTIEYPLNNEGVHHGPIDTPEGCRITALTKNGMVAWEGRLRGDKFRPAGRFRKVLGKEIEL